LAAASRSVAAADAADCSPITDGRIASANPELISRVRHDVVGDNDVDQYVTGLAYRCFVIAVSAPGLHTDVAFVGRYSSLWIYR